MNLDAHPPEALALCREILPASDGNPPEWLFLVPAGDIQGRDGRAYTSADPAPVVESFDPESLPPLDWEHATHVRAPQGQDAPAAGWITELDARDDGIWGKVDWNDQGAEAVRSRSYRYYSPAYQLDPGGNVVRLLSVGLTNTPNLKLPALNSGRAPIPTEPKMDESIRVALGLPEGATPDQAVAKITELATSLNRAKAEAAVPDLNKFVPRADLDAALNRAQTAEQAIEQAKQVELNRQIDTLISAALNSARITPATEAYHRAAAATEGGIERLKQYLDSAPQVFNADTRTGAPPDGPVSLNSEQARIAAAFGNTAETLAKFAGAHSA